MIDQDAIPLVIHLEQNLWENHYIELLSNRAHIHVTSEVHATALWHINVHDTGPYTFYHNTHISDMMPEVCKVSSNEGVDSFRYTGCLFICFCEFKPLGQIMKL